MIPWRTKWQPTPVFLSGESRGVRSLAGYSPWGCKELDMTEGLTQAHIPFVKADPEKSFIENPDSSIWADSHYFRPGDISQTLPACRSYTVCFGLIWLIKSIITDQSSTKHHMPLLLLVLSFHLILCPPEMVDSYILKTKIMASGPITSWQINGETMETVTDFIFLGSKITADGDCSHEIKRRLLLGRKAMTNLGSILKSRDITLMTKVHLVKVMVFFSSHVWTWELDHKETWAPKNWCFWTVVLEKTLESLLDCKEIQPVNPKGNQSWIFIGRIDAEAPILWPPDVKNWLIWKDPDAGKD